MWPTTVTGARVVSASESPVPTVVRNGNWWMYGPLAGGREPQMGSAPQLGDQLLRVDARIEQFEDPEHPLVDHVRDRRELLGRLHLGG